MKHSNKKGPVKGLLFFKQPLLWGALLLGLVFASCSPIEKDFIGEWQVYNVEVSSEWTGDKEIDAKTMTRLKEIRFEFMPDGKMTYTDFRQDKQEGTWSLRRSEYIDMEYTVPSERGRSTIKHESSLKIVYCQRTKIALREDFENGESITYYLELK